MYVSNVLKFEYKITGRKIFLVYCYFEMNVLHWCPFCPFIRYPLSKFTLRP